MRSRGFSLLEVMLALVVVAIGISVLLTFSASSQRETGNKATGNDYSLIVNDLLEQFISDNDACNTSDTCITNACASSCTNPTDAGCTTCTNTNKPICTATCTRLKAYQTMNATAYDYLCENETHSLDTCSNGKITQNQVDALKAAGINLTTTSMSVTTDEGTTTTEDSSTTLTLSTSSRSSDQ